MKRLTLIRHAKSDWGDHTLPDHDRPLNERGRKAAPKIGRILAKNGFKPAALISSSAARARATAEAIAAELGIPVEEILTEPRIYAAGVQTLLNVVNEIDESLEHVALIGHNPGFEDLANTLIPGHPITHLPTCAVVEMQLNVGQWAEADQRCAELIEYLYPKMLE